MADNVSGKADSALPISSADLPTHSDDGVDLTVIRWMLTLTPAERLQVLQSHVNSILSIRNANERH
jgi:hypothetical protein